MNPTIKAGIYIGVLCAIWTMIMGLTGWYKDPALLNLFYLVIPIEIGVLIWGLKLTAKTGKTYGGQLGAGVLMSVIGGVILFVFSIIFTTVIFPNYFEELKTMYREILNTQNISESEIDLHMQTYSATKTPFYQALLGFIGTVFTGFIASLVIAIFVRKKDIVGSDA